MKQCAGIWLPDNEAHLLGMLQSSPRVNGRGTYQYAKLQAAMKYVGPRRSTAIDIGAHVGLWSMHLVRLFDRVVAFEPVQEHRECFEKNVSCENISLVCCALGREPQSMSFGYEEGSTGGTHLVANGQGGDCIVMPLDEFKIADVDFIKVDVEGYERFVVEGGERTIKQWKPTIIIEQKPKGLAERYGESRMAAVDLLQSWGAKVRLEMSGDYILTF